MTWTCLHYESHDTAGSKPCWLPMHWMFPTQWRQTDSYYKCMRNVASLSFCNSCFKTNWHPLRINREKRYTMPFICRHLVTSKKVSKLKHLKDVLNVLLMTGSWLGVFKAAPCSSSGLRLTLCFFICWRRRKETIMTSYLAGVVSWDYWVWGWVWAAGSVV